MAGFALSTEVELRREPVLREARLVLSDFNPETSAELIEVVSSER